MKNMKKKKTRNTVNRQDNKHSFLFWLAIPVLLFWVSLGYVIGLFRESRLNPEGNATATSVVLSHFQEYESVPENLDKPVITFWFDDAWLSQYMNAYPILKTQGFSAAVGVPTSAVEAPNYVNWSQLRILQENGWEITNHSVSHNCEMDSWNEEAVLNEYQKSKLILWKNKLASDIFVSPCGVDSEIMRSAAKKMFLGYRTVDPGYNELSGVDFYDLKVQNVTNQTKFSDVKQWVDETKDNNYWLIIVFHKVGEISKTLNDDEFNVTIDNFKDIVSYVKEQEIQVVIPSQILQAKIQ